MGTSPRTGVRVRSASLLLASMIVPLALASCGGGGDDPIDGSGFVEVVPAAAELTGDGTIDSVTLVEMVEFFGAYDPADPPTVSTIGRPCSVAGDEDRCTSELARLLADAAALPRVIDGTCFNCERPVWAVVVTDADGARTVTSESAAELFRPIDTPTEVAVVHGRSAAVRRAGDGWQFITSEILEDCDPVVVRTTLFAMSGAGEITEDRHTDDVQEGTCI